MALAIPHGMTSSSVRPTLSKVAAVVNDDIVVGFVVGFGLPCHKKRKGMHKTIRIEKGRAEQNRTEQSGVRIMPSISRIGGGRACCT